MILVGTGSEVQLAVQAREILAEKGISARVVSMPCREWFDRAGAGLPRHRAAARSSRRGSRVEAGVADGLARRGRLDRPHRVPRALRRLRRLRRRSTGEFGITAEAVALAAEESISDSQG